VVSEARAHISVTGEWPQIFGVSSVLASVFQNLIENALKFTKPGLPPVLKITCTPGLEGVEITFADEGIGIPEDCHDKVFQIFHRLHSEKRYPGTGIGLSIVMKGVLRHGGRIDLSSTDGAGTKFLIYLPYRHQAGA
jgi:signal transduction histidine kinase